MKATVLWSCEKGTDRLLQIKEGAEQEVGMNLGRKKPLMLVVIEQITAFVLHSVSWVVLEEI